MYDVIIIGSGPRTCLLAPVVYIQTREDSAIWVEQVKVRGWKLLVEEIDSALPKAVKLIAGETDKNQKTFAQYFLVIPEGSNTTICISNEESLLLDL